MAQPKVSVIIPVYNVERYLRQCLDSAVEQTLKSLEIICVNDGSTDKSLDILEEYSRKDDRIRIIDKNNAGYGHSMNRGLDAARGEYVAFLESDDCIEEDAYEVLSSIADKQSLDIIKGNYYLFEEEAGNSRLTKVRLTNVEARYGRAFCPREEPWSFYIPMMNCLGLFRRDFIEKNHIRHNETPGAAHQDMGFWFQTLACATSMMIVDKAFYKYRQDNAASSMKNDKIVFSTLEEYSFIRKFLEKRPAIEPYVLPIFFHRKYTSSMYSYENSDLSLKLPFLRRLSEEFNKDYDSGLFDFSRFSEKQKKQLLNIMQSPDEYYLSTLGVECAGLLCAAKTEIQRIRLRYDKLLSSLEQHAQVDSNRSQEDSIVLSVVVPVYNSLPWLDECLDSILGQNLSSLEVICIDDGSTDGSYEHLVNRASMDSRLKIYRQDNCGQGRARNWGIEKASGKYIQFVDSDDYLEKGLLADVIGVLERDALDFVSFNAATVYESEELEKRHPGYRTAYQRHLPCGERIESGAEAFSSMHEEKCYSASPCLMIFSRRFLLSKNIKFPEGVIYEDNVFTLKAYMLAQRTVHICKDVYVRRVRESSTVTSVANVRKTLSYFEVYLEMVLFCQDHVFDMRTAKAVAKELNNVKKSLRSHYDSLDTIQRNLVKSVPPVKKSFLECILGWNDERKKRVSAEEKLAKIEASWSWRLGRALMRPFRKIRKIVGR